MNFTAWVDVGIGVSVVYLGASLFVTVINEYIAQWLNLRGTTLVGNLRALISDSTIREKLKKFPQLALLLDGRPREAPSYVDSVVLARLLLGSIVPTGTAANANATPANAALNAYEHAKQAIEQLPPSDLKDQLLAVAQTSARTVEDLTKAVSEWADRSLTMLGEGYKKNVQKISFLVGLGVAILCNVDTVTLTSHLYRDKEARDAAAQIGIELAEKTDKAAFDHCMALTSELRKADAQCESLAGLVEAVQSRNDTLGQLPIGWSIKELPVIGAEKFHEILLPALWWLFLKVVGWSLTALALSLGAPFWFDVLNRFVSVRHGMKRPDPVPEQ